MLERRSILLIISGGVAAYKSLDLIRRLRERGAKVTGVLTKAAQEFITPLSVASLSGNPVYTDLFSLTDEAAMGHIELSRSADLIVVAPATADLMAKMAAGLANDLASTLLLATDTPVIVVPAMNVRMWQHAATQRNVAQLQKDGIGFIGPVDGAMACGEFGPGRMSDVMEIVAGVEAHFAATKPLAGKRVLITSGPTREAIDPVRYISNHSSGKQGHALARAARAAGAEVTLVSGPVALPDPAGVRVVKVDSAREMLAAVEAALPADIAIFAAAVADFRVADVAKQKIKKDHGGLPVLSFVENPDILATIARHARRPALVVGFAAETENLLANARAKLAKKGCDLIIANDVSTGTGTFGGDDNSVHIVAPDSVHALPRLSKEAVADALIADFATRLPA